ncbi:hypothetical protein TNIN_373991, partial [Trichonephila inaurata madagascariensis]
MKSKAVLEAVLVEDCLSKKYAEFVKCGLIDISAIKTMPEGKIFSHIRLVGQLLESEQWGIPYKQK